jgi:DNA-binding NarL/FixJ family response regulator
MLNSKSSSLGYTILLIEDDEGLGVTITELLERGGYKTIVANSGQEGVRLANHLLPDLILCDILMPEMSGVDVLRTLHKSSDTAMIPFIFLTALAEPEYIRKGMELGADDYLTKPIDIDTLLNAVNSRLKRHQTLQTNRLTQFSQQLVLALEHEQQQLAYVLDNEINQSLLSLQFIFNLLEPSRAQDAALYDGAKELLQKLINRLDALAQELHPTILGRLGLMAAIRWLAEQYDLRIEWQVENLDYKFDPQLEVCAFRLIQASLNNIVHHAQTDEAKILLRYTPPYMEIRVEDKGVGFELEKTIQSTSVNGLQHMYGLVSWQKGELYITSEPGKGTTVFALLPQIEDAPALRRSVSQTFIKLAGRPQLTEKPLASTVNILLAMEQPLQRQGLKLLLSSNNQFKVVEEIGEMAQINSAIEKHHPHLLMLNPITEGKNQTEILNEIINAHPDVAILIISSVTHDEYVHAALDCGALGYIPNTATITDLNTAIMRVAQKKLYISPAISLKPRPV